MLERRRSGGDRVSVMARGSVRRGGGGGGVVVVVEELLERGGGMETFSCQRQCYLLSR